jgi:hypothetical protein
MWHYVNWAALLTVQHVNIRKYQTVCGKSHFYGISATSLWCTIHDKDCSYNLVQSGLCYGLVKFGPPNNFG